jgi:hypothetical protein
MSNSKFFKKLKKAMEEMVAHHRGELELHTEVFEVPDSPAAPADNNTKKKQPRKRIKKSK